MQIENTMSGENCHSSEFHWNESRTSIITVMQFSLSRVIVLSVLRSLNLPPVLLNPVFSMKSLSNSVIRWGSAPNPLAANCRGSAMDPFALTALDPPDPLAGTEKFGHHHFLARSYALGCAIAPKG